MRFPALYSLLLLLLWPSQSVISQSSRTPVPKETVPTALHAAGTFDVTTTPMQPDDATTGTSIGRYVLAKQYHGDLDATSKGEMLGAGTLNSGSAGYVAVEEVTGVLNGRHGSFALQHSGTVSANKFQLTVTIVPGSGTGDLAGISGSMTITIAESGHTYNLYYTLPSAP